MFHNDDDNDNDNADDADDDDLERQSVMFVPCIL